MRENAILCLKCNTRVVSRHAHDLQSCACKIIRDLVSVDGGRDYRRRLSGPDSVWIELPIIRWRRKAKVKS